MTKNDLIRCICDDTGLPKKDIKLVIESFFNSVVESLNVGEKVILSDFGKFYVTERKEKKMRDVQTKEIINIESRKFPTFKFSKRVRNEIK